MVNKKLDRLDFTKVYYLIGRLSGMSSIDSDMAEFADELITELDLALGYIDTEPKTSKEFLADHVHGETIDDYEEKEN